MNSLRKLFFVLVGLAWSSFSVSVAADQPKGEVVLTTTEWPPFEYTVDGTPKGQDVALVEEAFRRLQIKTKILFLPWSRALHSVQTGDAAGVFTLRKTKERERQLHFPSEVLSVSENVLFREAASKLRVSKLSDLRGRKVAIVHGYDYGQNLMKISNVTWDETRSDELAMSKLAAGRVDYFVCDRLVGDFLVRKLNLAKQVERESLVVSRFDMYLAFGLSKENIALARLFSKELAKMKSDGTYDRIVARNH